MSDETRLTKRSNRTVTWFIPNLEYSGRKKPTEVSGIFSLIGIMANIRGLQQVRTLVTLGKDREERATKMSLPA